MVYYAIKDYGGTIEKGSSYKINKGVTKYNPNTFEAVTEYYLEGKGYLRMNETFLKEHFVDLQTHRDIVIDKIIKR